MNFGEWLQAEMSTEDQWAMEQAARKEDERTASLYRLCCRQQFQLQKAVNEIARLELLLMDFNR
jgi:geranylgeranyl pyrophosphate synthase